MTDFKIGDRVFMGNREFEKTPLCWKGKITDGPDKRNRWEVVFDTNYQLYIPEHELRLIEQAKHEGMDTFF